MKSIGGRQDDDYSRCVFFLDLFVNEAVFFRKVEAIVKSYLKKN